MKRVATMSRSFIRTAGSFALLGVLSAGSVSAAIIEKTFEFGPGTQVPRSHVRTFPVPCGRQVSALVKYKRLGPAAASSNIPIIIEFREPDTAEGQEGPIFESRSVTATTTEQSLTLFSNGGGSARGCDLPWRVRVRHANEGSPAYAVSGTIRVSYDASVTNFNVVGSSIQKGATKTVNFGDVTGMKQGRYRIIVDWLYEAFGIPAGPGEGIVMKFELLNPSGTVVRTYPQVHTRATISEYFDKCTPGQWKWRITNTSTKDDATGPRLSTEFTPGC